MEEIFTFGLTALSCHFLLIIEGFVYSFGYNHRGQLGDGTSTNKMKSNKPSKINNLENIVSVAWGYTHSMAMSQNGEVYTWGCNENGELGDGTNVDSKIPKKLSTLYNIKMISCSPLHNSVAITNDGDVYCWGKNNLGQLGNGTTSLITALTPQKVPNFTNVRTISCGYHYFIAINEKGDVYSWGLNNYGQLGHGSTFNSTFPKKVNKLTNVETIVCGYQHALALTTDGEVYSWGNNINGELGHGNTNTSLFPQKIPDLANIGAISCGYHHSLALTKDGHVYAWGFNKFGELGVEAIANSLVPIKVNITEKVCTIACVGYNSMVFTTNGNVFVWGYNCYGQLCNGTTTNSVTPLKLELPSSSYKVNKYSLNHE